MNKNIKSLQYGRALAAFAVLAHHACLATAAFVERPPRLVETIINRGYLGVDFFFVLSGFIIMHAHGADARTSEAAAQYLKKRLARIYIPYLPVSLLLILLYLTLPSLSQGNREWGLLTSLTLLPTNRPPALSVAWTLTHEMIFYTIFLASYFTRNFKTFIVLWVFAILAAWSAAWVPGLAILRYLLSPLNLEFIAGMAAAFAYPRVSARLAPVLIGVGLAGAASYFMAYELEPNRVLFGASLSLVVLGVALLEGRNARAPIRWLLTLGNASYAIYLVHNPIVSLAVRSPIARPSWELSLVFCTLAGLVAGIAYHFLLERPAMAKTKKFFALRRATGSAALSGSVSDPRPIRRDALSP